jgi:RNA polymerase sigma-70 factor (ECF subfamily)
VVDRSLVERAQGGDRVAFGQLAADYADRLFAVAARILRDPDAAGDVLQVVLVDIWRDLPTLRDPDRFEAWAHRLVINRCRAHFRLARRQPMTLGLVPGDRSVGDAQVSVGNRDELERAFARLSAEQRAVLVLTYYRDLSLGQVAESLGVSVGTVKSRLFAARRAMRAALDADERLVINEGRTA